MKKGMQSQAQAGMAQHAEPAKQIAVTRILLFAAILEIAGLINPLYDKITLGPTFYSIEIVVIAICAFALYYAFSRRNKRDMREVIKTNLNLSRIIAVALIPNAVALFTQRYVPKDAGDNVSSLIFLGVGLAICYFLLRQNSTAPYTSDPILQRAFARMWVLVFISCYAVFSIIDTWYDLWSGEIVFGQLGVGSLLHEYGIVLVCGCSIAYFVLTTSHYYQRRIEYNSIRRKSFMLSAFISVALFTKLVGIYMGSLVSVGGLQRDDIGVMVGLLAAIVQLFV